MDETTDSREGLDPYTFEPALPPFSVSGVLEHAWVALKRDYWVLVGASFIYILIDGLVGLLHRPVLTFGEEAKWGLSGIDTIFVDPPLAAGIGYLGLLAVRLRRPGIVKAFSGFRRYLTVVLIGLTMLLVSLLAVMVAGVVAGLGALVGLFFDEPTVGAGIGALIGALPAIAFWLFMIVRLEFTTLIALDPLHDASRLVECLKASWELSRGHEWPLVGLLLVGIFIAATSFVLCCLPLLFLGLPFFFLLVPVAYEMLRRGAEIEV